MRPRRRPAIRLLVSVTVLGSIAVAAWLSARQAPAVSGGVVAVAPVSWQGLVGDPHPAVSLSGRMIVVLHTPSVAQRLARVKLATEAAERRWSAEAFAAQQQVLTQLARHGLSVHPDYSFARVLDGFSAVLDPRAIALLQQNPEVAGVFPVRAAFPAAISAQALRDATGPGVGLPGLDGTGISIALLDTGVDLNQPYLGGRVEPGIDIVGGTADASAKRDPQARGTIERHGTELAGILVGSGGPGGLHGVAPGATVLPIRVAGWQPAANGRDAIYGRSDQLIAGLERAVDPNGDGDAHDAVRVALIGEAEPFASFPGSPESQAVAGALALDVLVVAPGGNDGATGPLYGSIAGPAGSPAALAVGTSDSRTLTTVQRVVLSRGLTVLADSSLPLLDGDRSARPLEARVALPAGPGSLSGQVALVAVGPNPAATVTAAVHDGATAVLLYGRPLAPGSLGDLGVPVLALPESFARVVLSELRQRFPVEASLGHPASEPNRTAGLIASFSSHGLSFGGLPEPELSAPGIRIATSDPGSAGDGEPAFASVTGTSVSAAAVAAAAALVAQSRPGLSAEDIASLLTGSATPTAAAGAGIVDVGASAVGEVAASATSLGFGPSTGPRWRETRRLVLHNVSTRRLALTLEPGSGLLTVEPARLVLRTGQSAAVTVTARASSHPAPAVVTGILAVTPAGAPALHIPWAVALRPPPGTLIGQVRLAPVNVTPSDSNPAILRVVAGAVTGGRHIQIEPVGRLEVLLYSRDGTFLGVLARVDDLLPGAYAFGITGRGPGGAVLARGSYELRLVAWPVLGQALSRAQISFRIQ